MAALALGVASLAVFVAPVASIVVPIAGVVAGAAALLRIRREPSLAGRTVAIAGMMLAVFALSAGPTFWLVRERQLRRAAETISRNFVERLIEGDTRTAHQMTLAPRLRFSTDRPLADSYRETPGARDDLSRFARDAFVRRLRSLRRGRIVDVKVAWHESSLGVEWFAIDVAIEGTTTSTAQSLAQSSARAEASLLVERTVASDGGGVWRVGTFAFRESGAPSSE